MVYLLNGNKTLAEILNEKQFYISIIIELELLADKETTDEKEKVVKEFVSVYYMGNSTHLSNEENPCYP
ncbi:hypothetical protein JL193_16350 [Polaribacter batillariae]|uniref:Uncharacterized protein n=1 Tax=Polaribacter batillariae TaxID=2808900 RepID=A0ABX7STW9_9FLAO|nr:hypothetical protein [Polaribacter batillariae]QTD37616.1 hypothetical protein JL193_16350 [Polaribacter batillariae]